MSSQQVVFIVPHPLAISPSQRFRIEQYFPTLKDHQITFKIESFFDHEGWKGFHQSKALKKGSLILKGFFKRLILLSKLSAIDFVFIHREATPLGPPIFEWIVAKILKKKIIYDFDDAIWLTDNERESRLEKLLRCRWKVGMICQLAHKVSCGNNYLVEYAKKYNVSSFYIPTVVDTDYYLPKSNFNSLSKSSSEIIIGWTGSRSTLKYLTEITGVIKQLLNEFPQVKFLVIADEMPFLEIKKMMFMPWRITSEILDLQTMDIGVMPLPNNDWTKGKCGFKIIQYMTLQIPAVASAVGVNKTIIDHEENGIICNSEQEWYDQLKKLIIDLNWRRTLGDAGREKIINHYSISSASASFLDLFN